MLTMYYTALHVHLNECEKIIYSALSHRNQFVGQYTYHNLILNIQLFLLHEQSYSVNSRIVQYDNRLKQDQKPHN